MLVVCTANICRSPIAAGLLQRALRAEGLTSVRVESAGIRALAGYEADSMAVKHAGLAGIDLTDHRARQIDFSVAAASDLILAAEQRHVDFIVTKWPALTGRVHLLRRQPSPGLAGEASCDIPDPYGGEDAEFVRAMHMLESACADWVDVLCRAAGPLAQ